MIWEATPEIYARCAFQRQTGIAHLVLFWPMVLMERGQGERVASMLIMHDTIPHKHFGIFIEEAAGNAPFLQHYVNKIT